VLNAETSAHLALIVRFGPGWFREVGTSSEPGSLLVTVSGAVKRPGVFEVALGTPLAQVVHRAGGFTERPRAVLLGGYFGTWVPAAAAASLRVSEASFGTVRARVGAGAIVVLPESVCAVSETVRIARYLALESAGQCGPCLNGLAAAAELLSRLAGPSEQRGRSGAEREELERILGLVEGRGACRHPDGAARFIGSALTAFSDEFADHAAGRCSRRPTRILPLTPTRPR
jgi:NADH:ubiquinone oxidoreductase subunit F (NADH-binding)